MNLEQAKGPPAELLLELSRASGPRQGTRPLPCRTCQEPILLREIPRPNLPSRWQLLNPSGTPHHCRLIP